MPPTRTRDLPPPSSSDRRPSTVLQWSTGNVGRQSLRAVLERPDLRLVGVHAWHPEKVGVDAADLAGLPDPTGVLATDRVEDLLALGADVAVYNPLWPSVDELEALLAAGTDVVTSAAWIDGSAFPPRDRARVEAAALAGGATLYGSGAHPGLSHALALTLTGACRRVDEVRITESVDASGYGSAETMRAMGFGQHPDTPGLADRLERESRVFTEACAVTADALGATVDRFTFESTLTPATADTDLGFLQIPAGTVAGVMGMHRAWVGERCVVSMGFNWVMGPHVVPPRPIAHGHVIQVFGEPNYRTVLHTLPPADMPAERWPDLGMVLTAMPVTNAIPRVLAAPPGIVTAADLPVVVGRWR